MTEFKHILQCHGQKISIIYPDGEQIETYGFIQPMMSTSSAGNDKYSQMTPLGEKNISGFYCFLPADVEITDIFRTEIVCNTEKFSIIKCEKIFAMGKADHIEAVLMRKAGKADDGN